MNQAWDMVIFTDVSRSLQSRPLGAYRIASHLRNKGYRVKVIWAWQNLDHRLIQGMIRHHVKPDTRAVAISNTVMFSESDPDQFFWGVSDAEFRQRLRLFKEINPDIKIIVGGGSIPYADPDMLKQYKDVDYYVKGQGESIIEHVMDSIVAGQRPRTDDIIKPPIISDAFIPFEDFKSSKNIFVPEDGILTGEPLPLEIARGCIFKCSFCSYDLLGKKSDDYTKTLDSLVEEFRNNYERFGTTDYYIVDDIVNESDEKVDLLVRAVDAAKLDLHFSGYLRLDLIRKSPERMKRLRDIGFYAGFFGIETVNDDSGRAVGKGLGVKRMAEALAVVVDLYGDKFWAESGIIMGLPHDDADTKHRVMEWINDPLTAKVIKKLGAQPLGINTRFGHSEIDRNPQQFGYEILESVKSRRVNGNAWRTKTYDSETAAADAQWIHQQMRQTHPFSQRTDLWSLPFLIWVDDVNDRTGVMDLMCNNHGSETADQWYRRISARYAAKRKEYVLRMQGYQ